VSVNQLAPYKKALTVRFSELVLSLLFTGSVCMNMLRLLSLKMAAAIPRIQSFIPSEPRLHDLSHWTNSAGEGCPIE
jgi:hypothetical protein